MPVAHVFKMNKTHNKSRKFARYAGGIVRRSHLRSLISLFFVLFAQAGAEVKEHLVYAYYDVHANPGQSLLRELNASSPFKENEQVFHAFTTWNVRLSTRRLKSSNGRCRLSRSITELTATIEMPRLIGASPSQKLYFEKYFSALLSHELGHYDIGEKAAIDLERKIDSLPVYSSCRALEMEKNKIFNQTLSKYRASEIKYDTTTEHGKTQGAWLDN